MGCPTNVYLNNNIVFSICTHDPDTGVLTDADTAPTYRIYEEDTESVILNSTMAKMDDANTTGFYFKKIACTPANGFEQGKSYTIYIEATVDSDKGGISYGFTVSNPLDEVVDNDGTNNITLEGAMKLILSVLTAESSGGGTSTITFRDIADTKDRIVATVDEDGNRTIITTRDGA